ncbi:MAG TPA: chemotaxis protein CheX [bacterium]
MELQKSLITALEEILDKMAFMVFETGSVDKLESPAPYGYTSQIAFKGSITGTLNLYFTLSTAEAIARNLMGLRDGDELFKGTVEDALGEFANILMGRALSLMDPDKAFDLNLPQTRMGDLPATGAGSQTLNVEGVLDDAEPCRIIVKYQAAA